MFASSVPEGQKANLHAVGVFIAPALETRQAAKDRMIWPQAKPPRSSGSNIFGFLQASMAIFV